jgi:replicative DNA helicase
MSDVMTREPVTADDKPKLVRLSDLLEDLRADAGAAHDAFTSGQARGPVTSLQTLDHEMGGSIANGLHILHAGPGAGKSALGLQIAASCGYPALFVSCEMSSLELLRRHTARLTSTYLGRLKSGELSADQIISLARQAAQSAPNLAIGDATHSFASSDWIMSMADALRGTIGSVLIVIDSLHSWAAEAPVDADEYTRLGQAVSVLRTIAGRLDCPVLAIAERNRASMKSGGLSGAAGSRKIEYSSESLWELDREENATADASGEIRVTLRLAKNRNGSPGRKIDLLFHGALQRFREAN